MTSDKIIIYNLILSNDLENIYRHCLSRVFSTYKMPNDFFSFKDIETIANRAKRWYKMLERITDNVHRYKMDKQTKEN